MEPVGRIASFASFASSASSASSGALVLVLVVALDCGCSSSTTTGPQPGNTAPGGACTSGTDCGCWQCGCEGVSGDPGQAQLCESGKCPAGEDVCTAICTRANAKVASVTAVDSCEGHP